MQIKRFRLHRGNPEDAALFVQKGGIEVNEGVFHPHRHGPHGRKHKDHAAVGGKLRAKHQALTLLFNRAGDFHRKRLVVYRHGFFFHAHVVVTVGSQ